ncbi:MAG: hypothetical protein PHN42_00395 [Bacilli bacterium]|nr:hypothetical protein [Bacilli bacterium]
MEDKKNLNPIELQKLINQNYKITADEGLILNNLMSYYDNLTSSHEEELKNLTIKEQEEYQIKYNYELYSSKYKILLMQKNISYKSYHIKRIGFVRDLVLAKASKQTEEYKKIFSEFIDKLIEEIMNELKLTIEISKTIPHLRNSCIGYFFEIYKKIQIERFKLEFQPVIKKIQEQYNSDLKDIIEKTKKMPNKTEIEIKNIISKKKEILDEKVSRDTALAQEKSISKLGNQNNIKKSELTYNKILDLIENVNEFFKKSKNDGSMLNAESTTVRNIEKLEKEFDIIAEYLKKFNDNEVEKNKEQNNQLRNLIDTYLKYQNVKLENVNIDKSNEKLNQILKQNSCINSYKGVITTGQLASDNGINLLDDLIEISDLNQFKDISLKAKSS